PGCPRGGDREGHELLRRPIDGRQGVSGPRRGHGGYQRRRHPRTASPRRARLVTVLGAESVPADPPTTQPAPTLSPPPVIGVLALQGDVREHLAALERLGADARTVRRPAEVA